MTTNEQAERLRKLNELRELKINPYPSRFDYTHSNEEAAKLGENSQMRLVDDIIKEGPKNQLTVKGRIMTLREHGKLAFLTIQDFSGQLQVCFMENVLGKETYRMIRKFDMGDFIGVSGELFVTKHGQLTVLVKDFTFLGKTLRPLPEKWHGIKDQESIYRQRYLDTLMSEESKFRFVFRSKFIELIRQYLNGNGFLEIETPVLTPKASGATARPFKTHHEALDLDVFLRIAPETYLKRAVVGGFERVYEFAKCFRNEGMDPSHLQEFTMLEYYASYWDYQDNMKFTEKLFAYVVEKLFGSLKVRIKSRSGEMVTVDFTGPWPRYDFAEMISKDSGIDILKFENDADALRKEIKKQKIEIDDMNSMGYGNLCDALYKKVSRPQLIQPCFVINHPSSTKPLARRSDENPKVCESFQLLVNTWEVINAYSELVDPQDQRQRFVEQAKAKVGGDADAMEMEEDYLRAMEHGMPPMSGWGMGIDRIVALLTEQDNLKDVVLFPLMRPLEEDLKAEKKLLEKAKKLSKK